MAEEIQNDNQNSGSPNPSPDPKEIFEAWKTTIQVQQHFNDIQLKIRYFSITLFAAIVAAAGFTIKEHINVLLFDHPMSGSTLIAITGILLMIALYSMDFGYQHLLLAAVEHGFFIENKYKTTYPEIGLSGTIKKGSPFHISLLPWWLNPINLLNQKEKQKEKRKKPLQLPWEMDSNRRLHLMYLIFIIALFILSQVGNHVDSNTLSTDIPQLNDLKDVSQ